MERNQNQHQKQDRNRLFTTRNMAMMAVLVAINIILARFLSIQTDTLRISFELIPLVLAGMWLGPVGGAIVAIVGDVLGVLLQGLVWFPPLILGPLSTAILSGVATKYIFRSNLAAPRDTWKVVVTVVAVGILNSFCFGLIGSTCYAIMIKGNTTAFGALMWTNFLQRLATKPITIGIDTVVVTLVNRAVYKPVVSQILSQT